MHWEFLIIKTFRTDQVETTIYSLKGISICSEKYSFNDDAWLKSTKNYRIIHISTHQSHITPNINKRQRCPKHLIATRLNPIQSFSRKFPRIKKFPPIDYANHRSNHLVSDTHTNSIQPSALTQFNYNSYRFKWCRWC